MKGGVILFTIWGFVPPLMGQEELTLRTQELTIEQDELSADVQELAELQTQESLIEKLEELEEIMLEVTLRLDAGQTGGITIAGQTEIIERVYEAARQKNASQETSQTSQAMLDMLGKMLGKPEPAPSKAPSQGAGTKGGGDAGRGTSAEQAKDSEGPLQAQQSGKRTVPRLSGAVELSLPAEFQGWLDDYNSMDKNGE